MPGASQMAGRPRAAGEPPPTYSEFFSAGYEQGTEDDEFTLKAIHAGFFCGSGSNRSYADGKADLFDYYQSDTWSLLWIQGFMEVLGYVDVHKIKVYWLVPGKGLADGLRLTKGDSPIQTQIVWCLLCPDIET